MTRRLILMRHAKSSWDGFGLSDKDRPLNGRGQRSATAIGQWLRDNRYLPDQAFVSSAVRTRETFAGLGLDCPARFLDQLYMANPVEMLDILRIATGDTVLMLGHNPGTSWFAETLVTAPANHPRFADFPTCGTLVLDFPGESWAEVEPDTGSVVDFVVPRDLTA